MLFLNSIWSPSVNIPVLCSRITVLMYVDKRILHLKSFEKCSFLALKYIFKEIKKIICDLLRDSQASQKYIRIKYYY